MDDAQRLELKVDLYREIDALKRDKADNRDVAQLAAVVSNQSLDQTEKNRAIKDAITELARDQRAQAARMEQIAMALDAPPSASPRSRFSLRGMDPRLLLAAGIVGGAAAGKSIELVMPMIFGAN